MTNPEQHIESEWQFEAPDLDAVDSWLQRQPASALLGFQARDAVLQNDTYLDTSDWAVYRAGFALRLRSKGDKREATLKSLDRAESGPVRRIEVNQSLEGEAGILDGDGPVSARVRLIAGKQPLRSLFVVQTARQPWQVQKGGQIIAEIALDQTRVVPPEGETHDLSRVEVEEARPGSMDGLESFIDALRDANHLSSSGTSKFEAGLLAADLTPQRAWDLGLTDVSADATAGEFAIATLRRHCSEMLQHEPGTRLGEDPEELHDMRVAIRRQRAALSVFRTALPERYGHLRDELNWVGATLGEVRDLDVEIESLTALQASSGWEDAAAVGMLLQRVRDRREPPRQRLLEALDSDRYAALVSELTATLREGTAEGEDAALPVRQFAERRLKKHYRQFRRLARDLKTDSDDAAFHATRIQGKKLRYAVEFFRDLYGRRARRMAAAVTAVQDLLGEHQDCHVAIPRLRELALEGTGEFTPSALLLVGEMIERRRRRMAELRQHWPKTYAEVRHAWQPLKQAIKRGDKDETDDTEQQAPSGDKKPHAQPRLTMLARLLRRRR